MDKIFSEEIIDRYKHPIHRGKNSGQTFSAKNISCGDEITLFLEVKNGRIESAKFDGSLCSIANFGAELLLDKIIGQKIGDLSKITSRELLNDRDVSLLENPVRLKCFEIAGVALAKF